MASPVIDIDVGGTRVRTTTATLKQLPFLDALMRHDEAGTMKISKTDDGLIFLDRSPKLFMKVLDGLRAGGTIFAESASEASQLLEELAFLGAQASCPSLSAWEKSVIDQVTVHWGAAAGPALFENPHSREPIGRDLLHEEPVMLISACHGVLSEVLPVLGYGGTIVDDFQGHRMVELDYSRNQVNPSISKDQISFRLSAVLGQHGFVATSESDGPAGKKGAMTFTRKKLSFERPFIISVDSSEDPFEIGVNVVVHSLGKADLNGMLGTVVGYQGDRVVVKFQESACEKAFKRKNLMLTHVSSDDPFHIGVDVLVHSLGNADLNGSQGRVVGHQCDRVVVNFEEPIGNRALKRTNLKLKQHTDDTVAATLCEDEMRVTHQESSGHVVDGHPLMTESCVDGIGTSTVLLAETHKTDTLELDLQEVIRQSEHEALEQEQADVTQAILESIRESPVGIVLRLTHHDAEVRETLMTTDILSSCRSRVTEAGCELSPEWGNGALFLIPFREKCTFQELQLQGLQLDDLKPYNIVALRDDEDLVMQALAQVPRRRRPRCKREGSGSACKCDGSGSAGVLSMSPEAVPEAGALSDSAQDGIPNIKIVIERTFYTVKEVNESTASCQSAP